MGLEYLEITMACEEEFDFTFSEEAFATGEMDTVGGFYRHIMHALQSRPVQSPPIAPCPNVPVFFALRTALVEKLNVEKSRITPRAELSELIPLRNRRLAWRMLEHALPFRIPELRTPVSSAVLLWLSILASLPITFYLSWLMLPNSDSVDDLLTFAPFSLLLVCAPPIILAIFLEMTLQRCLPAKTVGSLVEDIAAREFDRIGPDGESCGPASVWVRYQNIVADHLGLDITDVTPDTTFRELGVD
ncbi:MAG: hypothetical protein L3K26_02490 [Candidatus Hydrogenedentes bacterium]|nr:hypothetical protein [Candidatus Hydrogenedentota bacterium]